MREIKFRAWDKKNKTMDFDFSVHADGRVGMFDPATSLHDDVYEDYEVMQFTGLKDKNGKEIYEGDILKVVTGMDGEIGVVEWATLGWNINWNYAKNLGKCSYSLACKPNLEVIGNIYENPELLK